MDRWRGCSGCPACVVLFAEQVWALPLDLLSISPILPRASATRFRGGAGDDAGRFAVGFALANGCRCSYDAQYFKRRVQLPLLPHRRMPGAWLLSLRSLFSSAAARQGSAVRLHCRWFARRGDASGAMGRCDVGHLQSAWPANAGGRLLISAVGRLRAGGFRWPGICWLCRRCCSTTSRNCAAKDAVQQVLGFGIDPTPVQRYVRANSMHSGMQQSLLRIGDA